MSRLSDRRTPSLESAKTSLSSTIKAMDAYGREVEVPREHWRSVILPDSLRQAWSDPDRLSQVILEAHADQFFEEVRDASSRLLDIDSNLERSHVIRAIVMRGVGNFEAADTILHRALQKIDPTARILMQMAQVLTHRKQHEKAKQTLWRAIEMDPNFGESLQWWLDLQSSPEATEQALNTIVSLPGSWLARIHLARIYLGRGELAQALHQYESVLRLAPDSSNTLHSIAADLGDQGHFTELLRLIGPRYEPRRDDPKIGLQLLKAYLQLQIAKPGLDLLEDLFGLGIPALAQALLPLSHQFDQLEQAGRSLQSIEETPEISLFQFDRPLWLLGAHDITWAAQEIERPVKIALLALTQAHSPLIESDRGTVGRENDVGTVSRSVPLYLGEALYFQSTLDAHVLIPVAGGSGLVLFGAQESDDQLRRLGEQYDYVLHGTVEAQASGMHLRMRLLSSKNLEERAVFDKLLPTDDIGPTVLALAANVRDRLLALTGTTQPSPSYWSPPPTESADVYLTAISQTLVLTLVRTPEQRAQIWGERNILHWMQSLAISLPDNEAAQFMFLTALVKARRFGSPLVREFERTALARARDLLQARRFSARLAPLAYSLYRRQSEFEWCATADYAFDPGYAAWCDRLAHEILAKAA